MERDKPGKKDDDCGSSCRELLRNVFERSESRPHSLVASMMSGVLEWRSAEQGIQVKIPTEESRPQIPAHEQNWDRHTNKTQSTTMTGFGGTGLVQATSVRQSPSEARDASSSYSLLSTSVASPPSCSQQSEWMNVSCQICPNVGPQGKARAYVNGPHPLDIVICSNRLRETPGSQASVQEMEEILTHELVHIYDARQLQLDLRECQNLAYSEVRAAREAECASVPKTFGLQASCVRERALLATQNLFPMAAARACVQKVFVHAMKDVRPSSSLLLGNINNNSNSGGQTTSQR